MRLTGAIIFDEFHERGAEGDLGLSLALDVQRHERPDLRSLSTKGWPACIFLLRAACLVGMLMTGQVPACITPLLCCDGSLAVHMTPKTSCASATQPSPSWSSCLCSGAVLCRSFAGYW